MPAVSKAQQRFMGACAHGAGYANCPKMSAKQFHDFASTKHKGLPEHVGKNYARGTASASLGNMPPLPKSIYGSDVIPAALTPKEMVLTEDQQTAVKPIPGKEHKLKPSQVKKLHAMNRKKGMPKLPSNLRLPTPRLKFAFGGEAPEGGGRRAGPGYIPGAMTNYQDAVDMPDDNWFWARGFNPPGGSPREALQEGFDRPIGGFRNVGIITGHPFNVGFGNSPNAGWGSWFQGNTILPTNWTFHPGDTMAYPRAIPVSTPDTQQYTKNAYSRHTPPVKSR